MSDLVKRVEYTPVVVVHSLEARNRLKKENPDIEFSIAGDLDLYKRCPNLVLLVDEIVNKTAVDYFDKNVYNAYFVTGWMNRDER